MGFTIPRKRPDLTHTRCPQPLLPFKGLYREEDPHECLPPQIWSPAGALQGAEDTEGGWQVALWTSRRSTLDGAGSPFPQRWSSAHGTSHPYTHPSSAAIHLAEALSETLLVSAKVNRVGWEQLKRRHLICPAILKRREVPSSLRVATGNSHGTWVPKSPP